MPTLREYAPGWYNKMIEIWTDRLARQNAVRTGALIRSVKKHSLRFEDDLSLTAEFRFLHYGVYVDSGRGPGSASGQMARRPWFRRSFYISAAVLARQAAHEAGRLYVQAFVKL